MGWREDRAEGKTVSSVDTVIYISFLWPYHCYVYPFIWYLLKFPCIYLVLARAPHESPQVVFSWLEFHSINSNFSCTFRSHIIYKSRAWVNPSHSGITGGLSGHTTLLIHLVFMDFLLILLAVGIKEVQKPIPCYSEVNSFRGFLTVQFLSLLQNATNLMASNFQFLVL